MSEKKLRTFKIEDDLYEKIQALGNGNATQGLSNLMQLAINELDHTDESIVLEEYPLFYAKYYIN